MSKKVKKVIVHWVEKKVYAPRYRCPSCLATVYPTFNRDVVRFICASCGQLLEASHIDQP